MNFRKFISGVSALAIAASAFAGMAVTASADESAATDGNIIQKVGNDDNSSGFWGDHSSQLKLVKGDIATFKFKNWSDKTANSHNWHACVSNDATRNGSGYTEYVVLQADNWHRVPDGSNSGLTSNFNWDTYKSDMDGSDVVVTFSYLDEGVKIHADITTTGGTKYFEEYTYTETVSETIRVWMSIWNCHLDIKSIEKTNAANTNKVIIPAMTYVDYNNADTAYGLIGADEPAITGYNTISGGSVAFSNTGWGVNYITYLQVDASAIQGTITKATLSFDGSGSTDSKRKCGYGAFYNSSIWSSTMTYNTADRSATTVGSVAWTSTKASGTFENKSIEITDAIKNDDDKIVTVGIYETEAAGGYVKNPAVSITYTNDTIYEVDFTVNGSTDVTPSVTLYEDSEHTASVTNGTLRAGRTYYYTATANGYKDVTDGSFTIDSSNPQTTINIPMTAKVADTLKVNYVLNKETDEESILKYETEDGYVDDTVSHYYPKYINVDNKWYVTTESSYKVDVTLTSGDDTGTVGYAEAPDVVEFVEVGTGTNGSYSGGGSGSYIVDESITLPKGVYEIEEYCISKAGNGSGGRPLSVYIGGNEVAKLSYANNASVKASFIVPDASAKVSFYGPTASSKNTDNIDYIVIRKTDDYTMTPNTTTADVVASSAADDTDYAGSVYVATLSGESDETTYGKVSATVTPNNGMDAQTKTLYQKITGAGSISVMIQITGLNSAQVDSVSVTLE